MWRTPVTQFTQPLRRLTTSFMASVANPARKTKNLLYRTIQKITMIQTTKTHHLQLTNNKLMTQGGHLLQNISQKIQKKNTTEKLKERNLLIDQSKTEKIQHPKKKMVMIAGKTCKYVGSLLGTTEDINRRKQLTNTAIFQTETHIY